MIAYADPGILINRAEVVVDFVRREIDMLRRAAVTVVNGSAVPSAETAKQARSATKILRIVERSLPLPVTDATFARSTTSTAVQSLRTTIAIAGPVIRLAQIQIVGPDDPGDPGDVGGSTDGSGGETPPPPTEITAPPTFGEYTADAQQQAMTFYDVNVGTTADDVLNIQLLDLRQQFTDFVQQAASDALDWAKSALNKAADGIATIVGAAVGAAIGGPVGAAVGGYVAGAIWSFAREEVIPRMLDAFDTLYHEFFD